MAAEDLPLDILFNIFLRLPLKSLAALRCVCKSWRECISHPDLETIIAKQEPTPLMFQQLPDVYPHIRCATRFLRVIQGSSTLEKEPVLEFWRKDLSLISLQRMGLVLGSCNGLTLVCLSQDHDNGTTLGVINTVSKRCHKLPSIKIWAGESVLSWLYDSAGIGFDYSTKKFKVVCVFYKDQPMWSADMDVTRDRRNLCTMVHVLGTDSWREIAQVPSYCITGGRVFAYGRLHWLASPVDYSTPDIERKIVCFDMEKEEFGAIDYPPGPKDQQDWINDQLVDLNGELGFAYNNVVETSIELWILKQKEWVMLCRIEKPIPSNSCIVVSGCVNNDGDILLTSDEGKLLSVYGLKKGDVREVDREDDHEAMIQMHRNSLYSI